MNSQRTEADSETVPSLAVALRRLAADLREGGSVNSLLRALHRVLPQLPGMQGYEVRTVAAAKAFDHESLSLPLVGRGGPLGVLRFGPDAPGEFTAGQIRLAAAVADLASVVLDHARAAAGLGASVEILDAALGPLTVGVLCFDVGGTRVYANPAAQEILGSEPPRRWADLWRRYAPESRRTEGSSWVCRVGERLIQMSAQGKGAGKPTAVILLDLAEKVAAFSESLEAALFRARSREEPFSLGVVAGLEGSPDAMALLETSGPLLPPGARWGPVDAETVGIIAAGVDSTELWRAIGRLYRQSGSGPLRAGVAAVFREDTPEALLMRAMRTLRTLSKQELPEMLVFNQSQSVTDTLAFILRHSFLITCENRLQHGLKLLQDHSFDGVILELPLPDDASSRGFWEKLVDLQPAARPFFVTDLPAPWRLNEYGLPPVPVFRKPFVVRELRSTIQNAFAQESA